MSFARYAILAMAVASLIPPSLSAATFSIVRNDNLGTQTFRVGSSIYARSVSSPLLNDQGRMIYSQTEPNVSTIYGPGARDTIYFQTPTTRLTVATEDQSIPNRFGAFGYALGGLSLNNNGTMIYSRFQPQPIIYNQTVIVTPEVSLTGSASNLLPNADLFNFSSQSLNDLNQIVFGAFTGTTPSFFRWQSGTSTLLATNGQSIGGFGAFGPVGNDGGSYAYRNVFGGLNFDPVGPMPSTAINPAVVSTGSSNNAVSLNEFDKLAFVGPSNSIYVMDPSFNPLPISQPLSATGTISGVSINDRGQVAYSRGGALYFAGASTLSSERLLGPGDSFGGSTIQFANISAAGLNNSNQLAFQYTLNNNTYGVAIIQVVPEVPAWGLCLIASVTMLAGRRMTKRP